jgi:hypothetical protein
MSRHFGVLAVCFLVFGCDYADPGVEGLTRGQFKNDASAEGSVGGDSGGPKDGSSDSSGDSGDSSVASTAFTGAGAFASNKPATSAVMYHNNNGVGVTPGPGVDCLSCHKMGGAGTQFLFAGTICADTACNTPAADKEVRVLGSDGKAFSAHSDDDGNFWYAPGQGEAIAFQAQTGARDGTNTTLMVGKLSASSCNTGGCHDGNGQAYVHLP